MIKKHSEISIAEWVCYDWIDITSVSDKERQYIMGYPNHVDDAIKLAGSIEKFKEYATACGIVILDNPPVTC